MRQSSTLGVKQGCTPDIHDEQMSATTLRFGRNTFDTGVQLGSSVGRRTGTGTPEWHSNCCLTCPVAPSQMMAVLSTLPLSSRSPCRFHLSEKMGPLWALSTFFSSPAS